MQLEMTHLTSKRMQNTAI